MTRWCFARFASPFAILGLGFATLLTGCVQQTVPAPIISAQRPYPGAPLPYGVPAPSAVAPDLPAAAPAAPGPLKVALLVPMTGASAEIGRAMLEAAQLALFEAGGDRFALVPRDTGGTASGAANAARAVIGEGARLILGPLLRQEVEAVRPIARDAKVNVVAFSTDTKLAGNGVYLLGFLPKQEVVREVSYARERGLRRFAALAPSSEYGRLMVEALRDSVGTGGGSIDRFEYYGADPAVAIQKLLPGSAPPPASPDASPAGAPPAAAPPPSAAPAAAPTFDALLLPEGGAKLKQIAASLKMAGLDPSRVRLLGSGLWDEPRLGSEPALVGGWYAAPAPEGHRSFEGRYASTYGKPPPRLASLGYDAAALAASLASGDKTDPFSQQALVNPNGFPGVDGMFRFTTDGLVQRGLAILEVQAESRITVSPPPPLTTAGY